MTAHVAAGGAPEPSLPQPEAQHLDFVHRTEHAFLEQAMGHDEMQFHLFHLGSFAQCATAVIIDRARFFEQVEQFAASPFQTLLGATLDVAHWQPLIIQKTPEGLLCYVEESSYVAQLHGMSECQVHVWPRSTDAFCGAAVISFLRFVQGDPVSPALPAMHSLLRAQFAMNPAAWSPLSDVHWGFGPPGQLTQNLVTELLKHGIPANVAESRAMAAIKAIGSDQIVSALAHRQPWKQLKMLGNSVKFQFVMPSELAHSVEANKEKAVGGKG